ncbi:hypothetical protein ACFPVY_14415 [Flavobacterium qiangtangense]|uniref:Curlin associated repeat-containing protein n=1 Tax=Flavobacterium qiangtangense TaxID=1442595 RepID=A0ABW1PRY8_9FLAO
MKPLFLKMAVITSFFFQTAFSQEEGENPGFDQYSSSVFDSKANALNLVSNMAPATSQSSRVSLNTGVLIQQIGDYNNITATLKSENISLNINQFGDSNDAELLKNANSIKQEILQQGTNNSISDFTYYTNYDVNQQMIQNGENQNITNIGTNSISKDMTVTQSGNGASVIILNQ